MNKTEQIDNNDISQLLEKAEKIWKWALISCLADLCCLYISISLNEHAAEHKLALNALLIATVLTANHKLVLYMLMAKQRIERFLAENRFYIILSALLLGSIAATVYLVYFYKGFDLKFAIVAINVAVSCSSLFLLIFKKRPELPPPSYMPLTVEQIYHIIIARIASPRLLSIWAAIIVSLGGLTQSEFLLYFCLAVLLIFHAEPKQENFYTTCRACGKKVLFGAKFESYCEECQPQKFTKPTKFTPTKTKLPKPSKHPLKELKRKKSVFNIVISKAKLKLKTKQENKDEENQSD